MSSSPSVDSSILLSLALSFTKFLTMSGVMRFCCLVSGSSSFIIVRMFSAYSSILGLLIPSLVISSIFCLFCTLYFTHQSFSASCCMYSSSCFVLGYL